MFLMFTIETHHFFSMFYILLVLKYDHTQWVSLKLGLPDDIFKMFFYYNVPIKVIYNFQIFIADIKNLY